MQVKPWQRSGGRSPHRLSSIARGAIALAQRHHRAGGREALTTRFVWWSALPMLVAASPALAVQTAPATPAPVGAPAPIVEFSADQVTYDSDSDVVTASGEVRMNREGNYLAADQVVWNRKSGQVHAEGNVVLLTPQ